MTIVFKPGKRASDAGLKKHKHEPYHKPSPYPHRTNPTPGVPVITHPSVFLYRKNTKESNEDSSRPPDASTVIFEIVLGNHIPSLSCLIIGTLNTDRTVLNLISIDDVLCTRDPYPLRAAEN